MENNNLAVMLDSLAEAGIYVIERDSHRLLYYNKRVKEVSPDVEIGRRCDDVWAGTCEDCPLLTIGDKEASHRIHNNDPFGEVVDIVANKMIWDGIPAYAIIVMPHKMNHEEQREPRRIEKMYLRSLVTVFSECIIVNLSEDFYVNCQKDEVWEAIPERGDFARMNQRYAAAAVHPEDLHIFNKYFTREAMLANFKKGRQHIIKKMRRLMGDGAYHMVEFTAARIESHDEEEYWGVLVYRDVNEEFLQEQKRSMEIEQLATAARGAYEMLISVNLTQNTYYMLEYDRFDTKKAPVEGCFDELIRIGASTIHPEQRSDFVRKFSREALLAAFEAGERQVSLEHRQMGDDGIYHWNSTQVVKVHNPYNEDVLEITLSKNIDEQRRQQEIELEKERKAKEILEEALRKAESANIAKSEFLSRMSHDIRTPMNAIMGMTTLAKLHTNDEEKLNDYLEKIEVSSRHLLNLINEVLDVSKIESGKLELYEQEVDLERLAREVVLIVRPVAEKKQQNISIDIDEEMYRIVLADEARLKQVLVNILENASKYTGVGGEIHFSLKELKKEEKKFGTYQFVIEDNGIGMSKDYLEHIFEPFSRAEDYRDSQVSGTGLGMTIVHNIISMMDGDIQIESEYGKGSCFTITLCLQKKELSKSIVDESSLHDEEFEGIRVLLVEDNKLNQQIAEEMLTLLGADVEIAENGREAVLTVMEKPQYYYDIIFMDIQMPIMDGYAATEAIRNSGKPCIDELPIIAMTANAFADDVKRSKMAGMTSHMSKPVDMEQLKNVLRKCCSWRRQKRGKGGMVHET